MSRVVSTHHPDDIAAAIESALAHLDLGAIVRGKRVAVKPNETWASAYDVTGVTQPDTLRAVLQAVQQHAPAALIVTGGAGTAEKLNFEHE